MNLHALENYFCCKSDDIVHFVKHIKLVLYTEKILSHVDPLPSSNYVNRRQYNSRC
jgi:hypothetical protein